MWLNCGIIIIPMLLADLNCSDELPNDKERGFVGCFFGLLSLTALLHNVWVVLLDVIVKCRSYFISKFISD